MGKAANNERIKLSATAYNNISVAVFAAGAVLPCFVYIVQEVPFFSRKGLLGAAASLGALLFSIFFRFLADRKIQKIKD
jgi:hypothetical protein